MKHILLIIIIYTFLSCRGREVDIPIDFEGERLVLWGKLEAGKPIRIEVNKTIPVQGKISENLEVNTAQIDIYKNGNFYTTLTLLDNKGLYGSDSLIKAGENYKIVATADGFHEAESELVTISSSIPNFSYTRKRDVEPELNIGQGTQDLITLYFKESEQLANSYFEFKMYAIFPEISLSTNYPSKANPVFQEEDCNVYLYTSSGTSLMMKGACIIPNTSLSFFVLTEFNIINNNLPQHLTNPKVKMKLATVSKEWFYYNQQMENQPEGIDHLVLPPQQAYTNIKNGYGIIYGYNSVEIELK